MPRTKRIIEPRPPLKDKSGHYTQDAAVRNSFILVLCVYTLLMNVLRISI